MMVRGTMQIKSERVGDVDEIQTGKWTFRHATVKTQCSTMSQTNALKM